MKRLLSVLLCCVLFICLLCAMGCEGITKEISSFEELNDVNGGNYVLANDIDCNYATITARTIKSLDGQGYTIRNCYIKPEGYGYDASFFTGVIESVKNVNFENIFIEASGLGAGVVATGVCDTIENVHIKNCEIVCTQAKNQNHYADACYVGGIYGGGSGGGLTQVFGECKIINCSVVDSSITAKGYNKDSMSGNVYAGGIAGIASEIVNCKVENSTIVANSRNTNNARAGGVVGILAENDIDYAHVDLSKYNYDTTISKMENCYSKNNKIGATAVYGSSVPSIGGVAGLLSTASKTMYCYAENNEIVGDACTDVYLGGLAGRAYYANLLQSYSLNNKISATGYVKDKSSKIYRRIGGALGLATSGDISSCFAYNDTVEELSSVYSSTQSSVAGFIATCEENPLVSNCAGFSKTLSNPKGTVDEFCAFKIEDLKDCYITSDLNDNKNDCENLGEAFWLSHSLMQSKLALMGDLWKYELEKLPYLNI